MNNYRKGLFQRKKSCKILPKRKNTVKVRSVYSRPVLRDIVFPRHTLMRLINATVWQSVDDGLSENFRAGTVVPPVWFV